MKLPKFIVIQNCPTPPDIGAYIAVVVNDAHATLNSAYRGADAEHILNKHGKHSQAQLYDLFINHGGTPANPPGFSTHELRSDGVAYPMVTRGTELKWWMQGFDVNDGDVKNVMAAARKHGWQLFQPYHSGSEFHHLNFAQEPKRPTPGTPMWARIWRIRLTYPTS